MVTISDLKAVSCLHIDKNDYDTILQDCLSQAEQYVASTILASGASGQFTEWHEFDQDIIRVSARVNDISIVSLTMFDVAFTENAIPSADYTQTGPNVWRFLPTAANYAYNRYKIVYTSTRLTATIDQLVRELAVFYFQRMPGQKGSLLETTKSAGGAVTMSFKTEQDFLGYLQDRIRELFLIGV